MPPVMRLIFAVLSAMWLRTSSTLGILPGFGTMYARGSSSSPLVNHQMTALEACKEGSPLDTNDCGVLDVGMLE